MKTKPTKKQIIITVGNVEWRKARQVKPEDGIIVMIAFKSTSEKGGVWIGYYSKSKWHPDGCAAINTRIYTVTHWAPMPSYPRM